MYGGEILHTDPCRACVTHGLGLMLTGRKWVESVLLKMWYRPCSLPQQAKYGSPTMGQAMDGRAVDCGCDFGHKLLIAASWHAV